MPRARSIRARACHAAPGRGVQRVVARRIVYPLTRCRGAPDRVAAMQRRSAPNQVRRWMPYRGASYRARSQTRCCVTNVPCHRFPNWNDQSVHTWPGCDSSPCARSSTRGYSRALGPFTRADRESCLLCPINRALDSLDELPVSAWCVVTTTEARRGSRREPSVTLWRSTLWSGKHGIDFLGCHLRRQFSGPIREKSRKRMYSSNAGH
jgi:hypothetical protein